MVVTSEGISNTAMSSISLTPCIRMTLPWKGPRGITIENIGGLDTRNMKEIILYFILFFEIRGNILSNQKYLIGLGS